MRSRPRLFRLETAGEEGIEDPLRRDEGAEGCVLFPESSSTESSLCRMGAVSRSRTHAVSRGRMDAASLDASAASSALTAKMVYTFGTVRPRRSHRTKPFCASACRSRWTVSTEAPRQAASVAWLGNACSFPQAKDRSRPYTTFSPAVRRRSRSTMFGICVNPCASRWSVRASNATVPDSPALCPRSGTTSPLTPASSVVPTTGQTARTPRGV